MRNRLLFKAPNRGSMCRQLPALMEWWSIGIELNEGIRRRKSIHINSSIETMLGGYPLRLYTPIFHYSFKNNRDRQSQRL
jgi:hypothetical protein